MSLKKSVHSQNSRKANNQRLIEVLGPVENLESYVKADWWRHIFNANYLRTDGDVVNDNEITSVEVHVFLSVLEVDKDAYILDLCCGQGRHVLEMSRQGYRNVYGLDRSHYLVNRAKNSAKKENLKVAFKEGDARKLNFPANKFDVVTVLGNSFGYFETKEDDLQVLQEIKRVLKPDGKLLIDITDGEHMRSSFEARSWEWIDKNYFVCRERCLSGDNERLISREVITHVNKGVIADQFYAERLYSHDGLLSLLNSAGFIDVEMKHSFDTKSVRNQDLGMMAKRNIVIGRADKPTLNLLCEAISTPLRIAVLMGDPGKDDVVKPGSNFDEDDLHTVSELKKALATLADYRFEYFNAHDNYLSCLPKWKRDFDLVLNLCDEGLNNVARYELHVPALLEAMNIPYSGGNPQCLAYCYDKSLVRGLASELDIPVANAYVIKPEDTTFIDINISFPVIIKPNYGDSSFGITMSCVCYNVTELDSAIINIRKQFGYDKPVLVEQYLTGKDLSVGVIGNTNGNLMFLPIIEEDYSELPDGYPHICGYEAKWDPNSPYWKVRSIPANLPESTEQFLRASCSRLFDRVECRDYARFDWRLDENETPRLLEVNPNPGWCWDGHLFKMAKLAGLSYAEMLDHILQAAIERNRIESVMLSAKMSICA